MRYLPSSKQSDVIATSLGTITKIRSHREARITEVRAAIERLKQEEQTLQAQLTEVDQQARYLMEYKSQAKTRAENFEALLKKRSLDALDVDGVLELIKEIDFSLAERLEQTFRANSVDGTVLGLIDETDLQNLGIVEFVDRKKVAHAKWCVENFGTVHPKREINGEKNVVNWTPDDVQHFLCSEKFSADIRTALCGISGNCLIHVTAADFKGVPFGGNIPLQERAAFLRKLSVLRDTCISSTKSVQQKEEESCVMCLADKRSFAFVPCGHVCLCKKCAATQNVGCPCPLCRAVSTACIQVFL